MSNIQKIFYNNKEITKIIYNNFEISSVNSCEEPPAPVPPITPTGVTFTAVSVSNVAYSGLLCSEVEFYELNSHNVIYGKTGNIKSISVGDCTISMGHNVFAGETNLETVVLPSSVVVVKGVMFVECTSLKSLTVNNTTPPTFHIPKGGNYSSLFYEWETPPADFRIYVPSTAVETYKTASGWSRYADIIQPIQ